MLTFPFLYYCESDSCFVLFNPPSCSSSIIESFFPGLILPNFLIKFQREDPSLTQRQILLMFKKIDLGGNSTLACFYEGWTVASVFKNKIEKNKPEGLLVSVTFSHGRDSRFNNVIFLDRIVVMNKLKPTWKVLQSTSKH